METVTPVEDCNRDIKQLLEAFGTAFSLEAIISAYSKASHNVDLAGGILYDMQGSISMTCGSKDEDDAVSVPLPELTSGDASQCPSTSGENMTTLMPSSIVSGVSGGEYVGPTLSGKGSLRSLSSEVDSNKLFATSCNSSERDGSNIPGEIEEFLFKMLGEGFQLDKKVIHEVLGLCGYDLEKSMETLVDISASNLEKSDDVVIDPESSWKYIKNDSDSVSEKSELPESSLRSLNQKGKKPRKKKQDKSNLEKELLGALFTGPERVEQPKPTKPQREIIRSSAFGKPVTEPLTVTTIEQTFVTTVPLEINEDEKDENNFEALRHAVKENWGIMKEYYKVAAEAFSKGDQVRAYKLMNEGQHYHSKAREADEKSAQMLLKTSCSDEEMVIDLSTLEPKQAIKALKLHLASLAGIPSIPSLKATVGSNDGQNKTRRLVVKLLEKESIKWSEGEDGKTIVVRLTEINPKALSFANKVGLGAR